VSDSTAYKGFAENITYQFSRIGVDCVVNTLDTAAAINVWNSGGVDFLGWYIVTGSPMGDPYDIMRLATVENGAQASGFTIPSIGNSGTKWFSALIRTCGNRRSQYSEVYL
jgi:ABC-type transport system substrate-binding protein